MNCVTQAWSQHEAELRRYLLNQLHDAHLAEDLLQDTFMKALAQGSRFCQLNNARAWLFRVAKNRLIDYRRTRKPHQELPEQLQHVQDPPDPVVNLAHCLPRALAELAPEESHAIRLCDLEGLTQTAYASAAGISVAGAKSRVQRARRRLQAHLKKACQVRFDDDGKVCCFVPRASNPDSK